MIFIELFKTKINKNVFQSNELISYKIKQKSKTVPHLSNINMDPSLCHTIKILLEGSGKKKVGTPGKADIALNGVG